MTETETLTFTDAAARKVGDLIRGEGNPNLKLRVFIQGGGCSGFQYGFEFDEQQSRTATPASRTRASTCWSIR